MNLIVPIYLIVILVAIPQLSETVYIPALVSLAENFNISARSAETTLTVYLLGFGVGVLLWGSISDKVGRKPGFIIGLILYALACYGCYKTTSIDLFYICRFFQAFGASVGSVLGQAVARDAISLKDRGRLFSVISMAMAFAPALGPVIGSFTVHYSNWQNVFLVLIIIALLALSLVIIRLPETRDANKTYQGSFLALYCQCFMQMIKDPKILGYGFMVGAVNGILFGYFAEAPFFFIQNLGVSSESFGLSSFLICLPLLLGSKISYKLNINKIKSQTILYQGICTILIFSLIFSCIFSGQFNNSLSTIQTIIVSYTCIFGIIVGVAMIIPNALSHALQNYSQYAGTAASLFGFYYYTIVSVMTALMAYMHNGSLTQLPLFLLIQGILMFGIFKITI